MIVSYTLLESIFDDILFVSHHFSSTDFFLFHIDLGINVGLMFNGSGYLLRSPTHLAKHYKLIVFTMRLHGFTFQ